MESTLVSLDLLTIPIKVNLSETPRWVIQDYPERDTDIEEWYFSYFYHYVIDHNAYGDPQEVLAKAKQHAEARRLALTMTGKLQYASENSILKQLMRAKSTGWFSFTGGYSEIRDLIEGELHMLIDKSPNGGKRYETANLLKVLDALEARNIPVDKIIHIPEQKSKALVSSGPILSIVRSDAPEEVKTQKIEAILDAIADPHISVNKFEESMREMRSGVKRQLPPPAEAELLLTKEGEILIIYGTKAHTDAIQRSTRGIVNKPTVTDGANLLKRFSERILARKSGLERFWIDNMNGHPKLVPSIGRGPYIPGLDSFSNMCFERVSESLMLIRQILEAGKPAWLLLHSIGKNIESESLEHWIQSRFEFTLKPSLLPETKEVAQEIMQKAISSFYSVPEDLYSILPEAQTIEIRITYYQEVYGLYLLIS